MFVLNVAHKILTVSEVCFSLTDPMRNDLHTFQAPTPAEKLSLVSAIHTQMAKWTETLGKKKKEKQEQKDMWDSVKSEIPLTIPVHSSTEKEFTAYLVDLKTKWGTVTVLKRYRQFLSLHQQVLFLFMFFWLYGQLNVQQ